jgi:CMP-N-acetylneuraminic acid synthetase
VTNTIAIIPARGGSERVPLKNIRLLAGHPLIAYTIHSALTSGVCDRVVVSTDSPEIADIARNYGAEVPGLRPAELAHSSAHDMGFLRHAMETWVAGAEDQLWAILRPTSPLRSAQSISTARDRLQENEWADSLRALKPVSEHPGKMWRIDPATGEATTYLDQPGAFNGPLADLESLHVQASSLEIVRRGAALKNNSIAGARVMAFALPALESLDINTEHDWIVLEHLVKNSPDVLPRIGD